MWAGSSALKNIEILENLERAYAVFLLVKKGMNEISKQTAGAVAHAGIRAGSISH